MGADLRIAIVTDVHLGPAFEAKAGPHALALLRDALADIERRSPNLLVDLGDRINNAGRERDHDHLKAVANAFAGCRVPTHHLLGNHDVKNLTRRENEELLKRSTGHQHITVNGWHLLFWSANPHYSDSGFRATDADLAWLASAMGQLDGPTVIFSHVPLGGPSMLGNYYFEGSTAAGATYSNLADIHDIVLPAEHLVANIAGHVHWNGLRRVDGVVFATIQSLSELSSTLPEPAAAWGDLAFTPDSLRLDVHGMDPWHVDVPLRRPGHHWLRRPGLPPYGGPPPPMTPNPGDIGGVILDLDGVLYHGARAVRGAESLLATVRATGRALVAATNHSGNSAAGVRDRLRALGLELDAGEIVTSIDATVHHLTDHHARASVLVVGSEALRQALRSAGFGDGDGDPAVVVVGYQPEPDWDALRRAAEAIDAGATFIGTNPDAWLPLGNDRTPETGPLLAYLERLTGQRPTIVGKPERPLLDLALTRLGVAPEATLVIGDTPATDIAAARRAGCWSALVLTGNTRKGDRIEPLPNLVFDDLAGPRGLAPPLTLRDGDRGRHALACTRARRP